MFLTTGNNRFWMSQVQVLHSSSSLLHSLRHLLGVDSGANTGAEGKSPMAAVIHAISPIPAMLLKILQKSNFLSSVTVWTLLLSNILVLASLESPTKSVLVTSEQLANSEVQDVVASSEGQTGRQTKFASWPDVPVGESGWRQKREIQKYQPEPPTLALTKYGKMSHSP